MKRILLLLTGLAMLACQSSRTAYEKGYFELAYSKALQDVERAHSKAADSNEVLALSIDKMIEQEKAQQITLLDTRELKAMEKALKYNRKFQKKLVRALPYLADSYQEELEQWRAEERTTVYELGRMHYEWGREQLTQSIDQGLKAYAQNAYHNFTAAEKYWGKSAQMDSLKTECVKNGRVHLLVNIDDGFNISYGWEIDRRFDDLESESNLFRTIYVNAVMNASQLDCEITLRFDRIDFEEDIQTSEDTYSKEVVKKYKTVVDSTGQEEKIPIYETVTGSVEKITTTKTVFCNVDIRVQSHSRNCTYTSVNFEVSVESKGVRYEEHGDDRAIPFGACGIKCSVDSDSSMVEDLLDELYDEISSSYF